MPKLTHSLPKYCKHKATGQAVVTINGRDCYLGPHGTRASRREYRRLCNEWEATGRSPLYDPRTSSVAASAQPSPLVKPTVREVAAAYLRFARTYYGDGPNSEVHRVKLAIKPLRELFGGTEADAFGPLRFKAVRQQLISKGHSRNGINATMRRLARVFKWAAGEELIPAAVYHALLTVNGLRRGKSEARETKPVRPVDAAVVDATLPHLPAVVADMVRVQRLAGCRPCEVCMIRPCDIDRSGDVWVYRPQRHKTEHHGRERLIFIGPLAQQILTPYLNRDPQAYCFSPRESELKRRAALRVTPLSCGNRPGTNRKRKSKRRIGVCYSPRSYHQCIRKICIAKNIARWAPNQLRHAAATEIRSRFGLEATQVILGHAKADVTQVYAERDREKGVAVAREIG
jgi:integrase